jgi:hypothetical protein
MYRYFLHCPNVASSLTPPRPRLGGQADVVLGLHLDLPTLQHDSLCHSSPSNNLAVPSRPQARVTPSRSPALLSLISASASTAGIPEVYYLSSSRLPSLNLTSTRQSVLSTTHPLVSTCQPVSSTISVRILSHIGQTAHNLAVPRETFHSSLRRLRCAADRSLSYFQRPPSSYPRSTESPIRNTTSGTYALHQRAPSSSSTQLVSNISTIRFRYYSFGSWFEAWKDNWPG